LAGNAKPATLILDGKTVLGPVDYGICSSTVKPPADSSYATVVQDGNEVYRLNRKIRFASNNFYTVFAFPTAQKDTITHRDIDTLIVTSTIPKQIVKENYAYIKIINAVPKLNRNYSLRLGCPNGEALATNVQYKRVSIQSELPFGRTSFSILRSEDLKTETIGLFNIELEAKKQYLIVILPDKNDGEQLYLMDESNPEFHPLTLLIKEENLTTSIRAINLSDSWVDFIKYPDSILQNGSIQSLQPKTLSDYILCSACGGQSLDTLACLSGTDTTSKIKASLNVSERYTLIAFDSANYKARTIVLAEPVRINSSTKAMIRVVNASNLHPEIIVSMAARDDNPYSNSEDTLGYRAGDLISEKTAYGKISSPKLITPGSNLPVTIFTTTEPANLVLLTTFDLIAGGRYLLMITDDFSTGKTLAYLVEENENSSFEINPLKECAMIQFVNLIPGVKQVHLALLPVLANAKLNYGASLTTVVTEGEHNLKINGKDTTIDLDNKNRYLFIFSGDETKSDILPFAYEPLEVSKSFYQRRFINASREIGFISIKENKETSAAIAERIAYGKSSTPKKITLDRNLSLFFVNSDTDKTLYRVDDMPFPFGKNYAIIFGGRSTDKSYSVVVMQEY